MLFFLSTVAIVLPTVLGHQCNMPSQMFGTASYSPSNREINSHYIGVDFKAQKAILWPLWPGYPGKSEIARFTTDFQYFDFKAKKVYTMDKKGKCSIDTIDSDIIFPAVNPATDTDEGSHGTRYSFYQKGDLKLSVFTTICMPISGSLLQIKTGQPIKMTYIFSETPIKKYDVMNRDLSDCK